LTTKGYMTAAEPPSGWPTYNGCSRKVVYCADKVCGCAKYNNCKLVYPYELTTASVAHYDFILLVAVSTRKFHHPLW